MSEPYAQGDNWTIYHGDCRDVLPTLPAASVSAVVTSPPYGTQRQDQYGGVPEAPAPDGVCRDCGTVVGDAPVCAPDVLIHAQPDEVQR